MSTSTNNNQNNNHDDDDVEMIRNNSANNHQPSSSTFQQPQHDYNNSRTHQELPPPQTSAKANVYVDDEGLDGDNNSQSPQDSVTTATNDQMQNQNNNTNEKEFTASLKMTVVNVTCNVVGGGILSLSSGFAKASPVFGSFLMLFTACVTFTNLKFIVDATTESGEYNYGELVKKVMGKYAIVSLVALTMFPFGALIAYCRIVADAMPPVFEDFLGLGGIFASEEAWLLIGAIVFFILSARRHLSELFISSIFGIATIFFAVFCVLVRYADGSYSEGGKFAPANYTHNPDEFKLFYVKSHASEMISLTAFAVSVHNNAPAYYKEISRRRPAKIMRAFSWAHLIFMSSYLIIAWTGYLTFGEERLQQINGDIMHAYSASDSLLNVARLLLFIHFVAVYPILQMAVRRGVNNIIYGRKAEELPMQTILVETGIIVAASALIAYVVPAIDVLLSLNGAIFGSIIILVIPSILYIRVVKTEPTHWSKLVAWFSLGYALVVAILSLVSTFSG